MLRFLLWRLYGLLAILVGIVAVAWLLGGGAGRALRGHAPHLSLGALADSGASVFDNGTALLSCAAPPGTALAAAGLAVVLLAGAAALGVARVLARAQRRYVRREIEAFRSDRAEAAALVTVFDALHRRLSRRWWRRLFFGQPSLALEVHHRIAAGAPSVSLAVSAPAGWEELVEAALRSAYPNMRLGRESPALGVAPTVLRLKKRSSFIAPARSLECFEHGWEPPMNRLVTVMAATREPAFVQVAITPTPALFERFARYVYKRHEAGVARRRAASFSPRERSIVEDAELRAYLELQHRPLFFVDLRVVAPDSVSCERIASELRVGAAENRLVERGTRFRHGLLGMYTRRVARGEGNPLPSFDRGVFATSELAALWQLPSVDFTAVPFARSALPNAPAPPGIHRPPLPGTLRDALGDVSIAVELRKQNTAVPGTVEQGKSSYLVASVAEDLRRERCAVIVLDPKGDAADAALSAVPAERTCTLLDFADPTCGFNPLAVDAPADVIADYVVAALKNLFTDDGVILRL